MNHDKAVSAAIYLSRKRESYRDKSFPEQDAFVTDTNRFVAAQCSRRAGKTNGLAIRFAETLTKHPGAFCPYIALTRESARNIMWSVMQEIDEKFKIGLIFTESNLTVTHPNGARLQLFGADMKNFIKRLKGIKTPGAAIDEAQDFGEHIALLVDDVLTPALVDYADSWLAITGTPGPIPRGYFYELTHEQRYGFSVHKWTLLDNPYFPNPQSFIDDIISKRSWSDTNPTLLREYYNKWVLDTESLLIKYNSKINDFQSLPNMDLNYILGIDIGHDDADALALLGWSDASTDIYLVEEKITTRQDITELTTQIESYMRRYEISKIVMDEGGLGKKIAEELRRRKHIPIHPADKARKFENVAFLNDYLRQGKFKAKVSSRFAKDSELVQIDWEKTTPDRMVVKKGFHSDIIDAVLYAFKESPAFTYKTPLVKPKYGTKEWAEQETTDMESNAEEFFKRLESNQDEYS